jgi:hypothetical protein
MTELKPSMILRYYTGENGFHYTGIVLKNEKILSVKRAGEKEKKIYDSLIHWLSSLPEGVTITDLDIQEQDNIPTTLAQVKKKSEITLKDIAPNYDLFRFLLTYESHSLLNSLVSKDNIYLHATRTYVKDHQGDLQPVKYNRRLQLLYSEYHDKFGSTLEEIGFPADADIYVKVYGWFYNRKTYRDFSMRKMNFPFTIKDYEAMYDGKFAFIIPSYICSWPEYRSDNHHFTIISEYLKNKGYYIWNENFRFYDRDSIFINSVFKYLEANIVVVNPSFDELVVYNYKPWGIVKIKFSESDEHILSELKSIIS